MSKAERSAHARRAKKTPKAPKPWDIPPQPSIGDSTAEPLLLAVGKALSSWETVENQLANLFCVFVGAKIARSTPAPAIRAYGTIVSFKSRAAMVDAAAKAYFLTRRPPDGETWADLLEALNGFSERRNDIAHGAVEVTVDLTENKVRGWFLFPGLYVSKKYPTGEPPRYKFTANHVNAFEEAFTDLMTRVNRYRRAVQEMRRSSRKKSPSLKSGP